MNSFEPDRIQTKPFKVVKEFSTMDSYADAWTGLILFLHRICVDPACLSLREELLSSNPSVRRYLNRTWDVVKELHAANTSSVTFADYLPLGLPTGSDGSKADSDASTAPGLDGLACSLLTMLRKLSISLVRHTYNERPFSNGVVAYCAVGTISSDDT